MQFNSKLRYVKLRVATKSSLYAPSSVVHTANIEIRPCINASSCLKEIPTKSHLTGKMLVFWIGDRWLMRRVGRTLWGVLILKKCTLG